MKYNFPRALVWLVAGWCAASGLHAQSLPQLENDYRNIFSLQPSTQWPPPTTLDDGVATPGQFRNGSVFGGWRTHRLLDGTTLQAGATTTTAGPTTLVTPRFTPVDVNGDPILGQGVSMENIIIGRSLVLRAPTVFFGDVIARPSVDQNGDIVVPEDTYMAEPDNVAGGQFYYSIHSKQVFATQPGTIAVTWRFRDPAHVPATLTLTYTVSSAPAPGREARRIFWTEKGFNGPVVAVPEGPIAAVNVRYSTLFPETVLSEFDSPYDVPGDPGVQLPPEKRTLWFSPTDSALHAYNREGRVFVEFLGAEDRNTGLRQFLGTEIVEVIREVNPATVNVHVGSRILPHDGDTTLSGRIVNGLSGARPFIHMHAATSKNEIHYYSIRTTTPTVPAGKPTGEVVMFWLRRGILDVLWPRYYDTYVSTWPDNMNDYTLYVRQDSAAGDSSSTGVTLDASNNSALVFQDDPAGLQAALENGTSFYTNVTATDPEGRALIRHTNGDSIWFERVYSQLNTTFATYAEPVTAIVGDRIEPPAGHEALVGYIRTASGTDYDPSAYVNPFTAGFDAARAGSIIPVNSRPDHDSLEVWWYKKSAPPAGTTIVANLWPVVTQKYVIEWPESPSKIVLASNKGSDDLPAEQAAGTIYFQNDANAHGFNPNDEHALMLGGRAYALRDDLGTEATSLPYVLLRYTAGDGRPSMRVFKVQREDLENNISFKYNVFAGRVLGSPAPLSLLPTVYRSKDTPANSEVQPEQESTPANKDTPQHYRRFTYTDRKGTIWLYRGPHEDEVLAAGEESSALVQMQYYYPAQTGFFIPGAANQPVAGEPMPYLRAIGEDGSYIGPARGLNAEPLAIGFIPHWPVNAPTLLLGETLTNPIRGLPAVRGQTSLEILYDQALAADPEAKSATLHDPTVAKVSSLEDAELLDDDDNPKLPGSVFTNEYRGKTYFPNLPPHLVQRLYIDPNLGAKGSLVLVGQFVDEILGEDYLLLNVLNDKDIADIKNLCQLTDADRTKWEDLVDGLTVNLGILVESAEQQGTYVLAQEPDDTKRNKIWNWIAARTWNTRPAVPTTATLRSGASLKNSDDVNLAIQWIEEHYTDLYDWKVKVAQADANVRELNTLRSKFSTHDAPTAPRRPTVPSTARERNGIRYQTVLAAYNSKLAEYNRRNAVHEKFREWLFSTDRAWSTPAGKAITFATFQAVDFPTVADNLADKTAAWRFVTVNRRAMEKWDAGRISPTLLAAIQAALKADFDANEDRAVTEIAVDELAEITTNDTPVDSYALTADGGGEGWLVLLAGNSVSLTPEEEPVSIQIIRVSNPLGRGELKVITPTNPLSEKLTLQHSLDFAANPHDFEFEWRTLPPVNGLPPTVYSFVSSTLVGDGLWNTHTADEAAPAVPLNLPNQVFTNRGDGADIVRLSREFNLAALPFRAFVSLDLGTLDGARVLVNGIEVARHRYPGLTDSPTTRPPLSSFNPLAFAYEVPVSVLTTDEPNVIEIFPTTTADLGNAVRINARFEVMNETDQTTSWIAVTALPHETASGSAIIGRNRYVIEGNSDFTLSDNYFICRYRARDPGHASAGAWSKWTDPQLAEGWIKRALAGINPFEQRVKDLYNNDINTDVSLVTQAGKRWEGDVALNLENIDSFGLIEIYETILRRGKSLSIEGAPAKNNPAVNDALLLAAGYLSDLYMLLGNEAYADASNPTIAYSTDGGTFGDVATSLFAFKGQLATVLDEELGLLRGRDDFLTPNTQVTPVFNRLIWNYTRGIDSGEAVYALNYNIKDISGPTTGSAPNGIVGAEDAAKAYPQGHGDAYGHYLTAITGYYGLLWNDNFSWTPRTEAVLVLGKPVSVDYLDERKFATAAAALARTAAQVTELTYRQAYNPASTDTKTWAHLQDGRVNTQTGNRRDWGVDDWGSRGGQGAFFNWLTANSTLPAEDTVHEGIQKIDRTTVPELAEVVNQSEAIQRALDTANAHLNPLGLSAGAVPFDIAPAEVDRGKTHFEQIYERATAALKNAVSAFNNAKTSTQILRRQEDSLADARSAIVAQERAYEADLIDLYGTPYPEDIGPGKTYKQGYAGPDLINFMYVDTPELFHDFEENGSDGEPFELSLDQSYTPSGKYENGNAVISKPEFNKEKVEYRLSSAGQFLKPEEFAGARAVPGRIQAAISGVLAARVKLYHSLEDYGDFAVEMKRLLDLYEAAVTASGKSIQRAKTDLKLISGLKAGIFALETFVGALETQEKGHEDVIEAIKEAMPDVVGLANDVTAPAKAAVEAEEGIASFIIGNLDFFADIAIRGLTLGIETREALTAIELEEVAWAAENAQWIYDLKSTFQDMEDGSRTLDQNLRAYDDAVRELRSLTGLGNRILAEREVFRQKSAALIQGYRTKDFGFRAFRNEALESYKSLFDLASRYTYLAARAYDYETGLVDTAGSSAANDFMQKIVRSRAVGIVVDGVPQPAGSQGGDPGLSGALARMNSDWAVAKSRFGFNNPDRYNTTFSLRREMKRILPAADADVEWKDYLASSRVDNLLDDADVRQHCLNMNSSGALAVPGFVLSFETQIGDGFNFFGQPLAGGDSTYSPTSFATKIRTAGIAFPGYIGMASPTSLGGTLSGSGSTSPSDPPASFSDPNALSATPYIYLIPAGVDAMRAPSTNLVRSWQIEDQAIPLPFDVGGAFSTATSVLTGGRSLTENYVLRKHQAFRAVPDGTVFSSAAGFTNSRLIGRSVWNSRWKIIIPGNTLLANPLNGMKTFESTVKDILIHFSTYSYSGN